jgi:hypothetical protein
MRTIITFLLICLSLASQGQEGINQLDSLGKKHGTWIIYLNDQWKAAKDTSAATYYRYTWYDHGVNVYPMGAGGEKGWTLVSPEGSTQTGKMKMLDGEYKWLDEKGRVRFVHYLNKGKYVWYKEFFPSGELNTLFDYTKKCDGQPHSWYICVYDKKGTIKYEDYTRKDEKGNWPVMRGQE